MRDLMRHLWRPVNNICKSLESHFKSVPVNIVSYTYIMYDSQRSCNVFTLRLHAVIIS